jgi:hypothetical protein
MLTSGLAEVLKRVPECDRKPTDKIKEATFARLVLGGANGDEQRENRRPGKQRAGHEREGASDRLMAMKGTLTLPDKQETALNTNLTVLMKW